MEYKTIPGPRPAPIVGNIPDLDIDSPVQSLMDLARTYGPIYQIELAGSIPAAVVSSQEIVNELCDESRFDKRVHTPLLHIRALAGDGLFTAHTDEPNWGKAHRILMPVFGPAALRNMFDGMVDIADQLLLMWERLGPGHRIDVPDNTTRLTLDTIALTAFNHRFNSFYTESMNPFVGAMVRALKEAGQRGRRLPLQNRLMIATRHQFDEDVRFMHQVADQLIADRRRQSVDARPNDILSVMLNAKDPKTGEGLDEQNIRYQMVTFLIAGHETTSGLLSFAIHELVRHPEVLARAREEVDAVLGVDAPRFEHLQQLTYLDQILKETLRLWPTAPVFAVHPRGAEEVIGGAYRIRNEQTAFILTPMLHRDPKVWGDDAEEFDPDHFSFENAAKLPPNAWRPFGNGQRSCIGRPFALQEATLFLAMMLQRFQIAPADPDYELVIKETLTLKPQGLYINATRRDVVIRQGGHASTEVSGRTDAATNAADGALDSNGIPIRVVYGSNAGSAEHFAQRIATDARRQGYLASIGSLDSVSGELPADGALIVVTASYEGQPPDNARRFIAWLDGLSGAPLGGVRYAVFGVGNRDWARTYQAIPKKIDEALARLGATRLVERGEANARGDFFGDFDRWYAGFWERLGETFGVPVRFADPNPNMEIEFVPGVREPIIRSNGMQMGTLVANRELVRPGGDESGSKRHFEVALPTGMTYRAGDYLAILPLNPAQNVDRALRRFDLSYDTQVIIHASPGLQTFYPVGQAITTGELLASYVELAQPATRQQVVQIASSCQRAQEAAELGALAAEEDSYESGILGKRVSVLDLLERYASSGITFGAFLGMLPQLKPRQYSISSSPRWSADHCTLTVAILREPALCGQGTYFGAASTYLADSRPGTRIAVTVRPSQTAFHPPESLEVPLIMVAAGTGIAPFRGFLQDRALRMADEPSTVAAPVLLFFGCRAQDVDFLYEDELREWERAGVVSVRPAFSLHPELAGAHVQDRLWRDRAEVIELVRQGAIFYLCGDGRRMAPAVHETCVTIYREATGATAEAAEAWMAEMELRYGRYVADVFS